MQLIKQKLKYVFYFHENQHRELVEFRIYFVEQGRIFKTTKIKKAIGVSCFLNYKI